MPRTRCKWKMNEERLKDQRHEANDRVNECENIYEKEWHKSRKFQLKFRENIRTSNLVKVQVIFKITHRQSGVSISKNWKNMYVNAKFYS